MFGRFSRVTIGLAVIGMGFLAACHVPGNETESRGDALPLKILHVHGESQCRIPAERHFRHP
ncbi:MAG: hypothetical protein H0X24_24215 [Ktedonobacterales bacterium]|nr:hypothetical protein [Ktedonobacterales bacterium]